MVHLKGGSQQDSRERCKRRAHSPRQHAYAIRARSIQREEIPVVDDRPHRDPDASSREQVPEEYSHPNAGENGNRLMPRDKDAEDMEPRRVSKEGGKLTTLRRSPDALANHQQHYHEP